MSRDLNGVWIPKELWLNSDLKVIEKIFLAEIASLDGVNGCYASNSYFSDFFDLSKTRCSAIIKTLKEKGYIRIIRFYEDGKNNLERRIIRVNKEFIKTKCDRTLSEKYRGGKPKESEANIEIENDDFVNREENQPIDVNENIKEIEEMKFNKELELSEEPCDNIGIGKDNKKIEIIKYNECHTVKVEEVMDCTKEKTMGSLINSHLSYLNTS